MPESSAACQLVLRAASLQPALHLKQPAKQACALIRLQACLSVQDAHKSALCKCPVTRHTWLQAITHGRPGPGGALHHAVERRSGPARQPALPTAPRAAPGCVGTSPAQLPGTPAAPAPQCRPTFRCPARSVRLSTRKRHQSQRSLQRSIPAAAASIGRPAAAAAEPPSSRTTSSSNTSSSAAHPSRRSLQRMSGTTAPQNPPSDAGVPPQLHSGGSPANAACCQVLGPVVCCLHASHVLRSQDA